MNSLSDIHISLGLVTKESPCIKGDVFGSLKRCQSSLTITANANIYSFIDTGQYCVYLSLKDYSMCSYKYAELYVY